MSVLLGLLAVLLTSIPLVMYLVYSLRRLDRRRQLLLQNILTLGLEDAYMQVRHRQDYGEWRALKPEDCRERFELVFFNRDFKADTSHADYFWPVALTTTLAGIGWYIVLSRFHPPMGIAQLNQSIPDSFAWGFVGAFFASVLTIIDEFRRYSLMPATYYSLSYRLLFSSTAAFLIGNMFKDTFSPLVAFGIGLFPMEQTWAFISEKTASALGAAKVEGELGAELSAIQGLEDSRNRRRLVDIGITSVQALATTDPLLLFFQTTLPMRTVIDMIDKAILYMYIGEKTKELRTHGINGVIELVALAQLVDRKAAYAGGRAPGGGEGFRALFQLNADQLVKDVAKVLGQTDDELKAFIYNMYYDPLVMFIYDVWGRCLMVRQEEDTAIRVAGAA